MKLAKLLSALVLMSSLILVGCNNKEKPDEPTSGTSSEPSVVTPPSDEDSSGSEIKTPLSEQEIFDLFMDHQQSYKDYKGDFSLSEDYDYREMLHLYDSNNVEVKGDKYKTLTGTEYDKAMSKELSKDDYSFDSKKIEIINKSYDIEGEDKILTDCSIAKKVLNEYIIANKDYKDTTQYKRHISESAFYGKMMTPYVLFRDVGFKKGMVFEDLVSTLEESIFQETYFNSRPDEIIKTQVIKQLEDGKYYLEIKFASNLEVDTNVFADVEFIFAYTFDDLGNAVANTFTSMKVKLPIMDDPLDNNIKYQPIQETIEGGTYYFNKQKNDKLTLTDTQIEELDAISCSSDPSTIDLDYHYKFGTYYKYINYGESAVELNEFKDLKHTTIKYYEDSEHTKEIKMSDLVKLHYNADIYLDFVVDEGYALIKENKRNLNKDYKYTTYKEVNLSDTNIFVFDKQMVLDKTQVSEEVYNKFNNSDIVKIIMGNRNMKASTVTLKNKGFYEISYLGVDE